MQINFAVLLAVLSASAASAVKITFYAGDKCHGAKLGDHEVHEVNHKYDVPANVQSLWITDNGMSRRVRAYDQGHCQGSVPHGVNRSRRFNGCLRKAPDETLGCYMLNES
ncbi:hypothetical protein BD779DRAFT_1684020 [Infundibulicybe gibba]|nr:hypothetical protein BD779DRAFT_1684020 [Infundibulicybe gibba]